MHNPDRPTHLFVSDVDGTLLDANKALSPATISAIGAAIELGDRFVLCSSRMPKSLVALRRAFSPRPEWMIAYNGALLLTPEGEAVIDEQIDGRARRAVYNVTSNEGLHASFYLADHWYCWGADPWTEREIRHTAVTPDPMTVPSYFETLGALPGAHKIMVMGDEHAIDKLLSYLNADSELQTLVVTYRTKSTYLEIGPAGTSKAIALEELAHRLTIRPGDITYFGDNDNDVDALRFAGRGLAMANASQRALGAADGVLAAGVDDGVATYLTTWLTEHPVTSAPL